MKKSFFKSATLILVMIFGLCFTNLPANNLPECENLDGFLKKEYLKTSKAGDTCNVRITGLQEKDALPKALEVCAKLKARRISSNNAELVYQLPGGLGHIIIQEVYEGDLFIRLTFDTGCNSLPFTELRLVSLKYYNSK
jgi:hypothetical protein